MLNIFNKYMYNSARWSLERLISAILWRMMPLASPFNDLSNFITWIKGLHAAYTRLINGTG